jgi:hypothetical protein
MNIADVHCTDRGGWKPINGETIKGEIVDIDVTEGAYGPYPVLELELEDGKVSVHAFHDLLKRKLKARGAQVGEVVTITYRGRTGAGVGTDAYLYDVTVGEQPKQFDFDQLRYTDSSVKPQSAEPPKLETSYGSPPDDDAELPF